ncbi:putative Ig domain-containing protein [Nostoc sp. NIES-2111]
MNPPLLAFAATDGSSFRAQTRCGLTGSTVSFNYQLSGLASFSVEQSTGNIIGSPIFGATNESGSYTCTAPTFTLSWLVSIRVDPMPQINLNAAELGKPFSFTPTGFPAGTSPFVFAIRGGSLAPGLSLDASTGTVSGTPSAAGSFRWQLRRTEANAVFRTFEYLLRVNDPAKLTVTSSTLDVEAQERQSEPIVVSFLVQAAQPKYFQAKLDFLSIIGPFSASDIRISPESARTPAAVTVSINGTRLSAGTYSFRVDLFPELAFGRFATAADASVTVRLKVVDKAPKLEVSPPVISQSYGYDDAREFRLPITVKNSGGGTIPVSGSIEFYLGSGWARLVPPPAALGPGETRQFVVVFTPKGLEPGTYSADAKITGTGQPMIPVRLVVNITPPARELILDGLTDVGTTRKTAVSRAVKVTIKNGLPDDRWILSNTSPPDGPQWYTITPASGKSGDSFQVIFDPTTLPPSKNFDADAVEVRVGEARRGKILSMRIAPYRPPVPWPDLVTLGSRIRTSPRENGDRTLELFPASVENSSYLTAIISMPNSNTGEPFFKISPDRGPVSGISDPANVVPTKVQVQQLETPISLPGYYSGAVIFAFKNAEDEQSREFFVPIRVVQLMGSAFNTTPPPDLPNPYAGMGLFSTAEEDESKEKCKAEQVILFSNLPPSFSLMVGTPVRIRATAVSGCGEPLTTGTVIARFTNGDPDLALSHEEGGVWIGTWIPRNQRDSTAVTLIAESDGRTATDIVAGGLETSEGLPTLEADGLRHGADFESVGEVAPGLRLTLRGSQFLQGDPVQSPEQETATQLGGVSVFAGASRLPLLRVTPTQIDAVIPADVLADQSLDLVIRSADGQISATEKLQVVPARPGIFRKEGSQTQGMIFGSAGANRILAEGDQAAERGSSIVILASGLGALNADGKLTTPVRVLFGESLVESLPESVSVVAPGVYEIVVQVPADSPIGSAVPVLLDSSSMRSRAATMAIR